MFLACLGPYWYYGRNFSGHHTRLNQDIYQKTFDYWSGPQHFHHVSPISAHIKYSRYNIGLQNGWYRENCLQRPLSEQSISPALSPVLKSHTFLAEGPTNLSPENQRPPVLIPHFCSQLAWLGGLSRQVLLSLLIPSQFHRLTARLSALTLLPYPLSF